MLIFSALFFILLFTVKRSPTIFRMRTLAIYTCTDIAEQSNSTAKCLCKERERKKRTKSRYIIHKLITDTICSQPERYFIIFQCTSCSFIFSYCTLSFTRCRLVPLLLLSFFSFFFLLSLIFCALWW